MPEEKPVSQTGGGKNIGSQAAAKAKQHPLSDTMRRFEDAHLNYWREVRDICAGIQDEFNQAYREQAKKFAESTVNADPATRFQAYRDHLEQVQKSVNPEDVQKRYEEAYRNYLRNLKDAWASLDVEAIEF
jgi:hypothetical protein